jgi:hypothetical protein
MNELVSLYLEVVRRPGVAKPYRDLLEFYRRAGQVMEAAAVADVLAERFGEGRDADDPDHRHG